MQVGCVASLPLLQTMITLDFEHLSARNTRMRLHFGSISYTFVPHAAFVTLLVAGVEECQQPRRSLYHITVLTARNNTC